jgi:predicted protein tyrosine phosphatase
LVCSHWLVDDIYLPASYSRCGVGFCGGNIGSLPDQRKKAEVSKNQEPKNSNVLLYTLHIVFVGCLLYTLYGCRYVLLTFAIVCLGYLGCGCAIVNKHHGEIDFISSMVLAPWLWGQKLSLIYYSRQCNAWDSVKRNVWMGRILSEAEIHHHHLQTKIHAVVDLTCEFSEAQSFIDLGDQYLNEQVLDLTAPSIASLQRIADFIMMESQQGVVYVHCKIGYSRSVAAIAAYLLYSGEEKSVISAVERIRKVRPSIVVRPEIWVVLHQFKNVINTDHRGY